MKCVMIILNYKDYERASSLAMKCSKFKEIFHVVIVDNMSGDGSYGYLKKIENECISVIQTDRNGGFAYGNNFGIKYALEKYSPEYILLANTDTIFENELILKCEKLLENNTQIALVSPRMKKKSGEEEKSSWKLPTYMDILKECFWINRHRNYLKEQKREYDITNGYEFVDVVRGSFMFFRTAALRKVDFFDENTFLYGEEIIICKKLMNVGYKVALLTDMFYIHNHIMIDNSSNELVSFKRTLNSEVYYLKTYWNINCIQEFILNLCICFGVTEWKLLLLIKNFNKRLRK